MKLTESNMIMYTACINNRYRKGMCIDNAVADVTDDLDLSAGQVSKLKKEAIRLLKLTDDWNKNRPERI